MAPVTKIESGLIMKFFARRRRDAEDAIYEYLMDSHCAGGYELSKRTGIRSGRLYPALDRMMLSGVVVDSWVDGRRLYALVQW